MGITASCGLVVLGLGAWLAGVEGPSPVDVVLDPLVQDVVEPFRAEARRIVRLGNPRLLPLTTLAVATTALLLRRPRAAVATVAGVGLAAVAVVGLQAAIGRTLDGYDALPSGHTAGAVAVATAVGIVIVSAWTARPRVSAAFAGGVVGLTGVAVALGLVANRLHVTTDTVAGFALGVGSVLATALGVDAVVDRIGRARVRGPSGTGSR